MLTKRRIGAGANGWMLLGSLTMLAVLGGCHRNEPANIVDGSDVADSNGLDPTDANMAQVNGHYTVYEPAQSGGTAMSSPVRTARVGSGSKPGAVNESVTSATAYAGQGQAAPIERRTAQEPVYPGGYGPPEQQSYDDPSDDAGVNAGMDAVEEADEPPPPLPVYAQPPAPDPNYLWTPGYWGYAPGGYFWVPGAWCAAPYAGALWTPGYWGSSGSRYVFHLGFWGRHIGFYGGVPYGFGYTGNGYHGGYWNGDHFFYNRAVNNINTTRITNVYSRTVIVNNVTNNRISYNGGRGGIQARPNQSEMVALREQRTGPMATQVQNRQAAAADRQQFFSQNRGRPAEMATARPLPAERGIAAPVRTRFGQETLPGQAGGSRQDFQQQREQQQAEVQRQQVKTQQVQVQQKQVRTLDQQQQQQDRQTAQQQQNHQRQVQDQQGQMQHQQRQVQEQQRQLRQEQDQQRQQASQHVQDQQRQAQQQTMQAQQQRAQDQQRQQQNGQVAQQSDQQRVQRQQQQQQDLAQQQQRDQQQYVQQQQAQQQQRGQRQQQEQQIREQQRQQRQTETQGPNQQLRTAPQQRPTARPDRQAAPMPPEPAPAERGGRGRER